MSRVRCEITVQGHLDGSWSAWFEGLTITNGKGGESVLAGDLPDQTALHGVLHKVRDLALPLVAVTCHKAEPEPDDRD